MTVTPLPSAGPLPAPMPDAPAGELASPASPGEPAFAGAVLDALAGAGAGLERAAHAERAFANGRGGLQEMILERAQADVMLSIASAAASRTTQALSTILGMQI